MKAFLAIMSLLLLVDPSLAEEGTHSGSSFLHGCEKFISETNNDAFRQGACAGVVGSLIYYSSRLGACIPEAVNPDQAIRVVVKYLNNNPEKLHQPFYALALKALQEAWPCNSR